MHSIPTLWKANAIAFVSSFCVMVIELIAARILAPYIGVSLYTWTSIIGVILAGIALGNYLGGKIADRRPSPLILGAIFLAGGLLTVAILPATKLVTSANWFGDLPVMWNFTLKTTLVFFLPAFVLSMVSPMVIKLTLADLGQTGGIVGTIYAFSTAGAILGTFLTGFYFILWLGITKIVWLVAAVLILMGIIVWFSWRIPDRWKLSLKNFIIWMAMIEVVLAPTYFFQFRELWQTSYAKESNNRFTIQADYVRESNYYTIKVYQGDGNVRILALDHLVHAYTSLDDPTVLVYEYIKVFVEMVSYYAKENSAPRILHLGGGGYTFPRYMETVYPESINEVVEIDPAVTQVAHEQLGLPRDTSIKTYNQDARLFLIQRQTGDKYNFVIGDVFSDKSTPYHLTTLEFDRLVKSNMEEDGIYLVNIIDDYQRGRYMPSVIQTLKQAFRYVYLFNTGESWEKRSPGMVTFVIAATDRRLDIGDYTRFISQNGQKGFFGYLHDEVKLEEYLSERKAVLLTDDYAPTDILLARLFR
ncbi:MAG: fused MFS/spermidine synthase [Chloroflexi bacterium]|nr:fused MFS/spermidine synthase [Chloroflexota bacterium]